VFFYGGDMRGFCFVAIIVLLCSCSQKGLTEYDLPEECGGKCEIADDANSFYDALVNSAAAFSNCVCLGSGVFEADARVGKSLKIIGRKDGSSYLKNLIVSDARDVFLHDFSFKGLFLSSAALSISGSSVEIDNVSFSDISAASVSGGRGIVISGNASEVVIKNSKIEKTDGTGILINGPHKVSLENVALSQCGFAGVWVQNRSMKSGSLSVENSTFAGNGAVALEILGDTVLKVSDSVVSDIKKREMMLESVGDGIVVKNRLLSEKDSVVVSNTSIENFSRAGIILDGNDSISQVKASFSDLSISSDRGSFGLVVQNGVENPALREGIVLNDFSSSDGKLDEALFIIDDFFEIQ